MTGSEPIAAVGGGAIDAPHPAQERLKIENGGVFQIAIWKTNNEVKFNENQNKRL